MSITKDDILELSKRFMNHAKVILSNDSQVPPVVYSVTMNGTQYDAIPETLNLEKAEDIPLIQKTLELKAPNSEALIVIMETVIVDTTEMEKDTDDPIELDSDRAMNAIICSTFTKTDTYVNLVFYTCTEGRYNFVDLGWDPKHTLLAQYSNPYLPLVEEKVK